jgi:hypothetical protein
LRWSRRPGWGREHRFALAAGALLTYVWYGFVQVPHDALDLAPARRSSRCWQYSFWRSPATASGFPSRRAVDEGGHGSVHEKPPSPADHIPSPLVELYKLLIPHRLHWSIRERLRRSSPPATFYAYRRSAPSGLRLSRFRSGHSVFSPNATLPPRPAATLASTVALVSQG